MVEGERKGGGGDAWGQGGARGASREKVNIIARSLAIFFQTAREWETPDRAGEMPLASGFARRALQDESKSRSRGHARAPPAPPTSILMVPFGPRLDFITSCRPFAALMFMKSAAALDMISALGLTDFRLEDAMVVGGV